MIKRTKKKIEYSWDDNFENKRMRCEWRARHGRGSIHGDICEGYCMPCLSVIDNGICPMIKQMIKEQEKKR